MGPAEEGRFREAVLERNPPWVQRRNGVPRRELPRSSQTADARALCSAPTFERRTRLTSSREGGARSLSLARGVNNVFAAADNAGALIERGPKGSRFVARTDDPRRGCTLPRRELFVPFSRLLLCTRVPGTRARTNNGRAAVPASDGAVRFVARDYLFFSHLGISGGVRGSRSSRETREKIDASEES